MTQYNYKAGLRNVGSYQASGLPYVSGGIDATITDGTHIKFPAVTRWIIVSNISDDDLRVAYSANGLLNSAYFVIAGADMSPRMEVRVTELHLSGAADVSVTAGLTSILPGAIDNRDLSPDGTNWSGSAGVNVG